VTKGYTKRPLFVSKNREWITKSGANFINPVFLPIANISTSFQEFGSLEKLAILI